MREGERGGMMAGVFFGGEIRGWLASLYVILFGGFVGLWFGLCRGELSWEHTIYTSAACVLCTYVPI
jgi:hypothetical protein